MRPGGHWRLCNHSPRVSNNILSIITLTQSTDRGLLQKMGLNAHFFLYF